MILSSAEGYDIVCLQESKRPKDQPPRLPGLGYGTLVAPRTNGGAGGGVAILVGRAFRFRGIAKHLKTDPDEFQQIVLSPADDDDESRSIVLTNFYFGSRNVTKDKLDSMTAQIANDAARPHLMLGDANAHHASWDSRASPDASGRALLEWAQQTGHAIVNTGDVTRRGNAARNQPDSAPDITMARNATVSGWQTTPFVSTDHYAITYKVKWGPEDLEPPQSALDPQRIRDGRTMYAWKKANWEAFAADVEQALASGSATNTTTTPTEKPPVYPKYRRVRVRQDLERLTDAIQRAAQRHCPRGKRPTAERLWSDTCEAAAQAAETALATHHEAQTNTTNEAFLDARDTLILPRHHL
jgi:hypothetical protein